MRSPHTATKSGPHSPQLEKARMQQRRPNTAKNKLINLKKNTPEGINSRLDDTKEWLNNLEDRIVEITKLEHQKEERNF